MVCYTIYGVTMAGSTISTFDLSRPLTNLYGINSLACEHFEMSLGTQNLLLPPKCCSKINVALKRCLFPQIFLSYINNAYNPQGDQWRKS